MILDPFRQFPKHLNAGVFDSYMGFIRKAQNGLNNLRDDLILITGTKQQQNKKHTRKKLTRKFV